MKAKMVWLVLAIAMAAGDVSAQMYKYVDEQGALRFVESLGDVPKKHRGKAKVAGEESSVSYTEAGKPSRQSPARNGRAKSFVEEKKRFTGSVVVYVTSWCPTCRIALAYLKQKGIAHTSYDIEKDREAKRRYEDFPGRGVPLIIVGDNNMRGFSSELLEQWLGL